MLAAALVMVAGMNCGGPKQVSQTTIATHPVQAPATVRPAPVAVPATVRPTPVAVPAVAHTAAPASVSTPAPSSGSNRPQTSAPASKAAAVDDELDIAIRDASDYLNDNIPKGSKIVILNIESNIANLSEYIIDELIANAVNDKNFSVVDRRQLDAIQSEQKFQLSGAVDDKDALAIGKFFGAQTIISGTMREIGSRYRMTIRALSVQTAQVQGQYNRNMAVSEMLTDLANSSGSRVASNKPTQTAPAPAATTTAHPAAPASPPIQGIAVPGENLTEKLAWLQRSADSHNTYIVEVNADEKISPYNFKYSGGINITVVLRGAGVNRTVRLSSHGNMFTVGANVTFVLENNITLHGHSGNNSLVLIDGGTFRMNFGSTIIGNLRNLEKSNGGGVHIFKGSFEMNGGTITGNSANFGGGVYVENNNGNRFIMTSGNISGNIANYGGGVCVNNNQTFTMNGGNITDNTAKYGGGVYMNSYYTTFNMKDGIITGNTAREYGGGVYVYCKSYSNVFITKTRGTVTGYNSDPNNGNVVRDEDGNILARRGHAVFVLENVRKETTAGPGEELSFSGSPGLGWKRAGAWDQ